MKQLISMILILLLLSGFAIPVFAVSPPPVSDNENILTEQEELTLYEQIQELKAEYNIDVMIVTTESYHGESAQQYADSWYDFAGGGEDGVLFLLSLYQREWYISTSGKMIFALTDYGIQELGETVAVYLSEGQYFDGLEMFLLLLPGYLEASESGTPADGQADYSGSYYHGEQDNVIYYEDSPSFFLALAIGMTAGLVTILIMRISMNTKRRQRSASVYMKEDTYHITTQRDFFLYSNISKVRKQQNTSTGGGSSVHRGSSGRSHGGGGGKF